MSKAANIWLALSQAATDIVKESLTWDEETQGDYTGPLRPRSRRLFEFMQDAASRAGGFAKPTLGGTVYRMWSLDFDNDASTLLLVEEEIEYLETQYPNQIALLGAWKPDGAMVGCTLVLTEVPNPDYVGEPFEIPNPDYQPDPGPDPENPDPTYDPRETIRNPAWVPETITERSQTGTPRHPLPNFTWQFMPPEVGATSNADLVDVNLLFGQGQRVFA